MSDHAQVTPEAFCWTRFGTEAGETIEAILDRKEQERRDNGVFFWGIGNSVAPGLTALLECCERPEVLFSPIKGRPRQVDCAPSRVVSWRAGRTLEGGRFELPPFARVTSGGSGRGSSHYALVCASDHPLSLTEGTSQVDFLALRNLVSGNPLGVSQVTAVVRRVTGQPASDMRYPVTLRARLARPYFVRLTDGVDETVRRSPAQQARLAS